MNVTWGLLTVLSVLCRAESRCSPTTYYKNCWIRRFPGIFIDIEESQRRGAQLLKNYQEETALKCSRTCCLTRNFSCNLAIFHYDAAQENINCFHLHCPTLESCILSHRGNVVLYNVTKGVDPDLLVFGKYFTSNVRLLPHIFSRANVSEPLPSDKRHFLHPPPPAALPATSAPTVKATTTASAVLATAGSSSSSMLHSPTHPSTTTSAFSSTSPTPLTDLGNHMQTTAPAATTTTTVTTTTNSPASSFMTSSSTITDTSLSWSDPDTSPEFPTTTAQPFTSTVPQPHTTSSSQSTTASMDITEVSQQYSNDTKDTVGRNHTTDDEGVSGEDVSEGPGWHAAAHTLLVAVAACVTILLSCCCSVMLVVSWRGQRKRTGRYRTSWRGKRGSMRLIKYVLVKETS